MKNITKFALFLPVSVVLIWLIKELYDVLDIHWTNGFTLQYILIFYLLAYAVSSPNRPLMQRIFMVLGGVFCLVGDTFLANALSNHFTLGGLKMPLGIAGFFIGHTFWFFAFLQFRDQTTKKRLIYSFSIVFGTMIVLWFLLINQNFNLLSILALIYCVALGTPLSYAIAHSKNNFSYKMLAVFYGIFIFSDLLIGMKDIRGYDIPMVGFIIWFTYIIALSGITYVLVSYQGANDAKESNS